MSCELPFRRHTVVRNVYYWCPECYQYNPFYSPVLDYLGADHKGLVILGVWHRLCILPGSLHDLNIGWIPHIGYESDFSRRWGAVTIDMKSLEKR